jgi:hypothetical protein
MHEDEQCTHIVHTCYIHLYTSSDRHEHAFCLTSSTGYETSTHSTGRLRVGWLVRVISESFSTLVLKTFGPTNTTRETSICSPDRRIRAMHDHSSPISVLSLPYPPIQRFFLVFRTCYHHRGSFSQLFWGGFRSSTHDSFRYSGTGFLS